MLLENSLAVSQYILGGLYDSLLILITVESSFSSEINASQNHMGGYL